MKKGLHALKNVVVCAIVVFLKSTRCTTIFANLDVLDYCNYEKLLCPEAGYLQHVVCQYYGKPVTTCQKLREVPFMIKDVTNILKQINKVRSVAANGQAIGKDQQNLPRAYGMMEISWDSELAAIAKVMLKQCLTTPLYDCAATQNFTDPIMTFMNGFATNIHSTDDEVVENILEKWETAAHMTTPDEILKAPDLKKVEDGDDADAMTRKESLFYLKMVVGEMTYVGCAAAVYDAKETSAEPPSGQVLCYFSHYAKIGTPVYNTTAPVTGTMYTTCGCPPKYRQNRDCLCVPAPVMTTTTPAVTQTKYHISSTQAYYNNVNNYQLYVDQMLSNFQSSEGISTDPPHIFRNGKERLDSSSINSTSQQIDEPQAFIDFTWPPKKISNEQESVSIKPKILKPVVQKNMQWAKQLILEPIVQQNEDWSLELEGKQPTTKAGLRTPSSCNSGVNCPPRIVMLPVFSLQNVYKPDHKRDPGINRRFSNISLVQSTIADNDYNFSEEDELPQNISLLRSKLLQVVRKMRKNELLDFFSKEQNLDIVHRLKKTTKRDLSTLESIEPKFEPYKGILGKSTSETSERNSKTSEVNSEPLKRSTEPSKRTSEPSKRTSEPSKRTSEPSKRTSVPSKRTSEPSKRTSVPFKRTSEPSKRTSVPSKRTSEPSKRTLAPPERNSVSTKSNLEPSKHNLDFFKNMLDPSPQLQTMIQRTDDDRNERAKKRAMNLLKQVEKKGRSVRLNSQEIVQFDIIMRGIYKNLMSTHSQTQS